MIEVPLFPPFIPQSLLYLSKYILTVVSIYNSLPDNRFYPWRRMSPKLKAPFVVLLEVLFSLILILHINRVF